MKIVTRSRDTSGFHKCAARLLKNKGPTCYRRLDLLCINNGYYMSEMHHPVYVSEWELNVDRSGVIYFSVALKLSEL